MGARGVVLNSTTDYPFVDDSFNLLYALQDGEQCFKNKYLEIMLSMLNDMDFAHDLEFIIFHQFLLLYFNL